MILESIVTSVDKHGHVNIAPMGPRLDWGLTDQEPVGKTIRLRPFQTSQTFHNLRETGSAVVHVTDDVELFARAAVDKISPEQASLWVIPLESTPFWTLIDCHRWFAVEVESMDVSQPRVEIDCRIVQSRLVRPFFGFNRAKHAVIEAAIVATRTHLLSETDIRQQLDQLQPLVDKTGGKAETAAFEFLRQTIHDRIRNR